MAFDVVQRRILADPVAESANQLGDGRLLVDSVRICRCQRDCREFDLLGNERGRDACLVALGEQHRLGEADDEREGLVGVRHV